MDWILKLPRPGGAQYGLKYTAMNKTGEYTLEVYKIHPNNVYHFTISVITASGRGRKIAFDSCDLSMQGWDNPYHAQAQAEIELTRLQWEKHSSV